MKKTHLSSLVKAVGVLSIAGLLTACGSSSTATTEAPETKAEESSAEKADTNAAEADIEGWSGNDYVLTWNEVNGEDYGATVGAHAFADKLSELSGGHITVDLYINGTLGSEAESMQGIQMGTLDIFRGNASSLSNYGAQLISTTGLPYVFENMEQFEAVAESDLGQELLDSVEAEGPGYVALGWLVEGPRNMFITEKCYAALGNPTEFTLDMMKGLKIRVPETDLMLNTMDALGASATAISYSELYTSLQSGVVDGAENGVTSYISNSFNEVAPYYITDAHTFGAGVILMNEDKWNSFNDTEKEWIKEASLAARDACYEYNEKQEQACYDAFEEKGITKLEVTDLEKWQEACAPLYANESEEAQAVIEKIQSGNY